MTRRLIASRRAGASDQPTPRTLRIASAPSLRRSACRWTSTALLSTAVVPAVEALPRAARARGRPTDVSSAPRAARTRAATARPPRRRASLRASSGSSVRSPCASSGAARARPASAERADARRELVQIERLDEVVVRAGIEAGDAIADRIARSEDQHRPRVVAPAHRTRARRGRRVAAGRGRAARRRARPSASAASAAAPSRTQSTTKPSWRRPRSTAAPIIGSSSARRMRMVAIVVPAQAGTQRRVAVEKLERRSVPACAGTTKCPDRHFVGSNFSAAEFMQ